ncbi:DMT family transporter [Candidatus Bathyarchaeota archaeon]|nr:DMT family transporter [Candidatus Bathyarchaeota archaeon]
MSDEPRFPPNLVMLVSIVAVSTASILIRWSDAPAVIIAMYRMLISVALLLPFFIRNNGVGKLRALGTRGLLGLAGVGVVLAIHFASWITSLGMTSVASSVIFVHIDPIFVAVVSHFLLKERINRRVLAGIIISLVGVVIIAMGDAVASEASLKGDLLALLGGLMLGIYLLGGRMYRKDLDLTTYVVPVYASAALSLVFMSLLTGAPLTGYASSEYLLFFFIALVPMIFGHTLYNWALRYVSAPVVSVSLLGEPVGASILAFLLLNEVPSGQVLMGGIVTLAGILLSSYRSE